ncbi:hypothetical protein BpHYR1_022355 [Brachionus plicatilis]|uniref:Uncharacterized protein n=1 Tax=Brachionus plicatilis TaxID=10195 RepID=A0A3M7P681_BRAPC|nr:hypothetical protein BpHYR1_022355 [Brachionus plicatilis]
MVNFLRFDFSSFKVLSSLYFSCFSNSLAAFNSSSSLTFSAEFFSEIFNFERRFATEKSESLGCDKLGPLAGLISDNFELQIIYKQNFQAISCKRDGMVLMRLDSPQGNLSQEESISKLKQEIESVNKATSQIKKEDQNARDELAKIEKQINDQKQRLEAFKRNNQVEYSKLKSSIGQQTMDLRVKDDKIKSLMEVKEELVRKDWQLTRDLERFSQIFDKKKDDDENLKLSINSVQNQINDYSGKIRTYQGYCDHYNSQISNMSNQFYWEENNLKDKIEKKRKKIRNVLNGQLPSERNHIWSCFAFSCSAVYVYSNLIKLRKNLTSPLTNFLETNATNQEEMSSEGTRISTRNYNKINFLENYISFILFKVSILQIYINIYLVGLESLHQAKGKKDNFYFSVTKLKIIEERFL